MSANYSTALKNDRMQKVIDRIDAGASFGKLKIYTAGGATLLSTIVLPKPSFGAPAGGQIVLAGTPLSDADAAATGAPATASFTDSNDTVIVSGLTVGTVGTDVILAAATIQQHDQVTLNSGTLTHG